MTEQSLTDEAPEFDRVELNDELYKRPPVSISPSSLVIQTAHIQNLEQASRSVNRIRGLLGNHDELVPGQTKNFELLEFEGGRFQWERHTEFTKFALIIDAGADEGNPFMPPPSIGLPANWPEDWIDEIEGGLIAATRLQVVPQEDEARRVQAAAGLDPQCASSLVADERARIWVDGRIQQDGCTRVLIEDRGLGDDRRARLVQRLVEIETYRMMAMLAFPTARSLMGDLHGLESGLREIVMRVAENDQQSEAAETDAEETLHELLILAAEVERLSALNSYRFDASHAYFDIVNQRLEELKEDRIQGHQRLSNFLNRRLGPAMETVSAVRRRIENLSGHIDYTASLIRTRVDLDLQRQNRSLLGSMDRRAGLQLRLQQTLEWLSLTAMSYYGIGIVLYVAQAAAELGAPIQPKVVAGVAAPFVIAAAWWIVHQVRKLLREHAEE